MCHCRRVLLATLQWLDIAPHIIRFTDLEQCYRIIFEAANGGSILMNSLHAWYDLYFQLPCTPWVDHCGNLLANLHTIVNPVPLNCQLFTITATTVAMPLYTRVQHLCTK